MGHLEQAGKKIFDIFNTGKHLLLFAYWGMRLGAGKLGLVPILGSSPALHCGVPIAFATAVLFVVV